MVNALDDDGAVEPEDGKIRKRKRQKRGISGVVLSTNGIGTHGGMLQDVRTSRRR